MITSVPEDYNKDRTDTKIIALGGMVVPLNIFLFQEINVLQAIIVS